MPEKEWLFLSNEPITKSDLLVEQILRGRSYDELSRNAFAHPSYESLFDPYDLPNVASATKRIDEAIKLTQPIVVYGDYDIDGLCATALLYQALSMMGAKVTAYIPDRFEEGYGLNNPAIEHLASIGTKLIISVDCGISSVSEIETAQTLGVDVIVTDHHNLPPDLPQAAVALINPKLAGSKVYDQLAGVGVAFGLARALAIHFKIDADQTKWWLDLVALGTICDSVPLLRDNWLLVRYGLLVLAKSRRIGLQTLSDVAGVDLAQISVEDVGFRIGPRLNAAGRLEHAKLALKLLMTTDRVEAKDIALKLEELNARRQAATEQIYDEAYVLASKQNRATIVLASEAWSHTIVGVVASRISEKFNKPTMLFQIMPDKTIKGSARSVVGYSIIDGLEYSKDFLLRYGGHAFAAGATLAEDKLTQLHDKLDSHYIKFATTSPASYAIDATLIDKLVADRSIYEALCQLAPFGAQHAEPYFMACFDIVSLRAVGKDRSHMQLQLANSAVKLDAIAFRKAHAMKDLSPGDTIKVVYRITENNFLNQSRLQLVIVDFEIMPQAEKAFN